MARKSPSVTEIQEFRRGSPQCKDLEKYYLGLRFDRVVIRHSGSAASADVVFSVTGTAANLIRWQFAQREWLNASTATVSTPGFGSVRSIRGCRKLIHLHKARYVDWRRKLAPWRNDYRCAAIEDRRPTRNQVARGEAHRSRAAFNEAARAIAAFTAAGRRRALSLSRARRTEAVRASTRGQHPEIAFQELVANISGLLAEAEGTLTPLAQVMLEKEASVLRLNELREHVSRSCHISQHLVLNVACARAKRIVRRNWWAIDAVASELDADGCITKARFSELVEGHYLGGQRLLL